MVFKKTFILALVLLLLGAYFYFFEVKENIKKIAQAEKAKKVFVFAPQEVDKLKITKAGESVVCHRQDDNTWTIKEPLEANGDKESIEILLTSLLNAEIMRVVDENCANLKDFGLDHPKIEVGIRLKGGSSLPTLFLGNNNIDASGIYGKLSNSSRVFIVDGMIRRGLVQGLYLPEEENEDN